MPAMTNGATRCENEHGRRLTIAAIQPSATACSARPAAMNGRPPYVSDRMPAAGATNIVTPVQASRRRPGADRRVAEHESGGTASAGRSSRTCRSTWRPRRRSPRRTPGCGRSASAASASSCASPTSRRPRPDARRRRSGRAPRRCPSRACSSERRPNTMQNRPTTASDEARDVELVERAARLAQMDPGERDRDEADRDVEPEDPLPGDAADERAADHGADRDGEAGDAAPRAEDRAALLGRRLGRRGSSA